MCEVFLGIVIRDIENTKSSRRKVQILSMNCTFRRDDFFIIPYPHRYGLPEHVLFYGTG